MRRNEAITLLSLLALVSPYLAGSPAYGLIDLFPGFEGDQIEVEEGEFHTPSSLLNSRDSYGILVKNERDLDTVEVQVILPEEFQLLSVREEPEWDLFLLPDNTGRERIIIWNGSTIKPGAEETFVITIQNPTNVFVYHFISVQIYANGESDVWRPWVQVIPSNQIGGLEFVTLGVGAVVVALALPLVESLLGAVRKKGERRGNSL